MRDDGLRGRGEEEIVRGIEKVDQMQSWADY